MKFIIPFVLCSLLIAGFLFNNKTASEQNTENKSYAITDTALKLKAIAKFPIGASVDPKRLYIIKQYGNIVSGQFNSVTTENALKWATVQPEETRFNFNKGDSIVAFAQKNGLRVHGHVLVTVSSSSLPEWVNEFKGDDAAWESMFKNHIQTIVKHYKGKIASWDVVNETFDEKGQVRTTTQSNEVNNWAKHLGSDYTAKAFQYAREADPDVLLFYNDNKQESSEKKLNAIINMVADFKKRGIPIDGLGLQMHININTSNNGIANALRKLTATGLKIHISELDIRINPKNNSFFDSTAALKAQADKYYFIAHAYTTIVPKAQQYGITFWNVTDKDSWITLSKKAKDSPLLFDKNYKQKTAFNAFCEGLKQ